VGSATRIRDAADNITALHGEKQLQSCTSKYGEKRGVSVQAPFTTCVRGASQRNVDLNGAFSKQPHN
jgi:hypothetical protein